MSNAEVLGCAAASAAATLVFLLAGMAGLAVWAWLVLR